jgi:ribosome-binding factor A
MEKKPKSYRKEKLPELIQHLAADFIQRESSGKTLITVTSAELSTNKKRVTIYFTVLPEGQEEAVEEFLSRRKRDFFDYVDLHARVGRMPEIRFTLDRGEKNRQRIDFLINNELG